PVVLTKAISKFMKDNADTYTFKTGVVDGNLVDLEKLTTIANLPSKEELISKLLFVLNAQAQRIVTVINAVPRDLAIVIKQIGDKAPAAAVAEVKAEEPAPVAEAETEEVVPAAEEAPAPEAAPVEALAEEAPATEATEAESEATAAAPDDAAEEVLEIPAAARGESE